MSAFKTLRAEIRHIVDAAERRITGPAIFAALTRQPSTQVFGVTLSQMVSARQLRKRKAPQAQRVGNVRLVYGPGPVPVSETAERDTRISATKGFMQIARERRAKARARARGASRAALP